MDLHWTHAHIVSYSTATLQLTTAFSPSLMGFRLIPWFVNLFARRYIPYSQKTNKPIACGTGHGSCQARMKNYLAQTRDSHPCTSVQSLWARQPCIGAPRKDSREAVWRSVQPGLAWPGLASMVPLGNYKHEGLFFLCRQCVHLARPLVGRGSCFIFCLVEECNFVRGC